MAEISTIQKRIEQLDKLQAQIKINRDMLKGELENELPYLECVEEVKAVTQKRKQIKDEILGRGPNQEILKSIKDDQEEISTLKEILSAELMEFWEKSQTEQIADRKFKVSASLLPRKEEYRNGYGQYTE